jgi:ABC-2 type transport system ATP-binding protein
VVSVTNVSRRFGNRLAVEDVTFDVRPGEVFGLLGPNGAGKTTMLRMIGGLNPPSSSRVAIDGETFTRASGAALRARIAS